MAKPKNVLVALGWYDHRLLQGIATYATEHRWHLAAHSIIHEKVIPWGWEGDAEVAPGSTTVEITLTADEDGTLLRLRPRQDGKL